LPVKVADGYCRADQDGDTPPQILSSDSGGGFSRAQALYPEVGKRLLRTATFATIART
jgi:hypothetical protein